MRRIKAGLRAAGEERDYAGFGRWFSASIAELKGTRDHQEPVAAFLEKREPRYTGE